MKILKYILKYLSYLSPILIKKYSFDFDFKAFVKCLKLNTQSFFGDEKQVYLDRKMGRKKSDDLLYMHENNDFIFLKSRIILDKDWLKITYKPDSMSIIWIRNKSPLKFLKLSIPGLLGFFYLAISVFLIFEITMSNKREKNNCTPSEMIKLL